MRKLLTIVTTLLFLLTFTSTAFAANAVSQMATTKGGQHVAQCAQTMEKGVSDCAQMTVCVN